MELFRVLTFKDDVKQTMWAQASQGRLEFRKVSRLRAVFVLLLCPLLGPVDAVLFRYLNDRKRMMSSLMRLVLDSAIAVSSSLRGVPVYWLAHNVDCESKVFHPTLVALRRRAIGFFSSKIFVTEDGLIKYARSMLPYADGKPVLTCTFGASNESAVKPRRREAIPDGFECIPAGKSHYFVSLSNWSTKKSREAEYVLELARSAVDHQDVHFVIGGDQTIQLRRACPRIFSQLQDQGNVSLLFGWVAMEQLKESGFCSAIIKSYGDLSLPLGVMRAASLRLPVIAESGTFLGELVERYGIGIATSPQTRFEEILLACNRLGVEHTGFELLLASNTWRRGALALLGCEDAPVSLLVD